MLRRITVVLLAVPACTGVRTHAADSSFAAALVPAESTTVYADTDTIPGFDSAFAEESQEEDFQSSIDSLFDSSTVSIDTAGWDTNHINVSRFASADWKDTARLILVDSARGRRYCHPCGGVITSNFGIRRYMWHYGVDTRLSRGDSVRVIFDGVVRVIQFDKRGYGRVVVVRHANGLETLYGHLSKVLATPGQRLACGEAVGLGGSTGRSTGPHLHFEIRYRGEPFNPNDIVDFQRECLKSDTLVLTQENFAYLAELRKMKWTTVRKGDNLGKIARRHHTTIRKLCQLNHITGKTLLRIGRKLRYQ